MMKSSDSGKAARVTQAFLKMKKCDIAALQEAYDGQ
jgi:predicted 3-demethylubiquinone-9 3-methyltransferase (glyoxalase superfamily)